jgi:hypothetical protein
MPKSAENILRRCPSEFVYLMSLYSYVLKIELEPKADKVKGYGGNYHYQAVLSFVLIGQEEEDFFFGGGGGHTVHKR